MKHRPWEISRFDRTMRIPALWVCTMGKWVNNMIELVKSKYLYIRNTTYTFIKCSFIRHCIILVSFNKKRSTKLHEDGNKYEKRKRRENFVCWNKW